jgi:serine/threonine protein kinase
MVTGQLPWTKKNQAQLFDQIRRGEYAIPLYVSRMCADLIQRLMTVDYRKRITIAEALSHPFLTTTQFIRPPLKANGFVSLKRVDDCFGHVVDEIDADAALDLRKSVSVGTLNFEIGLKHLKYSVQFINVPRPSHLIRRISENPEPEPKKRRRGLARFFRRKDSHEDGVSHRDSGSLANGRKSHGDASPQKSQNKKSNKKV